MKPFNKSDIITLIIVFVVLLAVSTPNFIASLRRARDQTRRDDIGALNQAFDEYLADFNNGLPASSPDGRIVDCLKPGDKPVKNKSGGWIFTPIPCDWGKDSFVNLISGKVYMTNLPEDPNYKSGATYLYLSDGNRYQIYAAMEGADEPEVDSKIIARNLMCGNKICNIGRSYNVPSNISIEEYDKLLIEKSNAKNQK